MAHIVAIEDGGVAAGFVELALHQVGDGGLARAGQAGEPQHRRLLVLRRRAGRLVHVHRLPVHVLAAAQGEADHAGADGGVGHAVDQDEAAQIVVVVVGLEG